MEFADTILTDRHTQQIHSNTFSKSSEDPMNKIRCFCLFSLTWAIVPISTHSTSSLTAQNKLLEFYSRCPGIDYVRTTKTIDLISRDLESVSFLDFLDRDALYNTIFDFLERGLPAIPTLSTTERNFLFDQYINEFLTSTEFHPELATQTATAQFIFETLHAIAARYLVPIETIPTHLDRCCQNQNKGEYPEPLICGLLLPSRQGEKVLG